MPSGCNVCNSRIQKLSLFLSLVFFTTWIVVNDITDLVQLQSVWSCDRSHIWKCHSKHTWWIYSDLSYHGRTPCSSSIPPNYGAWISKIMSCMSISQTVVLNLWYFFSMRRNAEIPDLQLGKALSICGNSQYFHWNNVCGCDGFSLLFSLWPIYTCHSFSHHPYNGLLLVDLSV
jgi:hypothetical protein